MNNPLYDAQTLRRRAEEKARSLEPQDMEALSPEEARQTLHELRVHQIELEMQNDELRRAQAELEASRARYFDLYDLAPVGYFTLSEQGLILEANLTAATLLGVARGVLVKQPLTRFILPEDQDIYYRHRKALFETGAPQVCELRMLLQGGTQFWARIDAAGARDSKGAPVCRCTMSDISGSKRASEELLGAQSKSRITAAVLDLLNRTNERKWIIRDILNLLKTHTGMSAVAIRLKEGHDFPYFLQNGFSVEFVEAERSLCERTSEGMLVRDGDGNVILECMCGNVLQRRTDPSMPFFTKAGSFWTNSTTDLLASTGEKGPRARTRNRCNREGYESVALIPLRSGDEIIGLMQLNDSRRGRFTEEMIRFYEEIGNSIGIALNRRDMEESLARAAREWAMTFDAITDPILLLDREQHIRRCNRAFADLVHLSFRDLVGRKCHEVVHGIVEPMADCPFFRTLSPLHREVSEVELGRRTFIVTTDPILDAEGQPAGAVHCLSDITDRKRAEEALRESEERYRTAIEHSNDGVAIVEGDRHLFVNRRFVQIFGYDSPEEIIGQPVNLCVHPDDKEEVSEISRLRQQGESVPPRYEFKGVRKDGTIVYIEVSAIKTAYRGKTVSLAYLRDITDRKRAEAERERLMAAIEQAGEIVFMTDPKGTIQYVNPAFETVTGYTRREALGQTPRMLKSGKQDETFYRGLWETISGGRTWKGRIVNKRKDGKLYSEETTISPVCDASGRIVNYVAVKRDITEYLRLSTQFEQAQKLEAVGRLTGGIAHDFNNLLTTIIGNADMAIADLDRESPLYEFIEDIKKAGERAASLTRQLLAFSRKQVLQPEVVNLNEVVGDIDKMLRRVIREDIELETVLASELGMVEADIGQIEQVIMNLAVNARDAMPEGGKLTIETANVELDEEYARAHIAVTPGPYVMLCVSDTGIGMSPEVQAQVFEPFFTTKEKGKGTGLGLSMVYGIVKQSRGNIWVYSEVGRGTSFKICLPRVEKAGGGEKGKAARVEARGGSETVLVVEDEKTVRNFAARILSGYGYKVLSAGDGLEAMEVSKGHEGPIHLLLTDVVMPGMSGRELGERLKGLRPEMKALYMSGYTDNAIVNHGILEQGIAFIQKPFTHESLARKVREALERNDE